MKRLVIFKFVKSFAGVEDTMLDEKLLNELPGIFNWVMSVSSQLSELKSLPVSSSQERMVAMYERAMDPIKAFIDDEIIVEQSKQGFISSKELYEAYGKWCEFEDIKKLARERFISKIKERLDDGKQINYKKRRASGLSNPVWGFEGITLSSKEASEFDDNPLH